MLAHGLSSHLTLLASYQTLQAIWADMSKYSPNMHKILSQHAQISIAEKKSK